ncbi:carboxypeptidase regulatory-like domain-containing protein [bacterium]|nr:carboxypeptidase regulatory-like domain-containing protein [bacterium]
MHFLFCIVLFSFPCGAEPRQTVSVSGRVVNRTQNAPVPGQEVTLVQHRGDAADQVRAVTGADGVFQFEQVALEDSSSLSLTTSYLGVPYVTPDEAVRRGSDLEVAVYDTTSSDAAVRADAYHLLVNAHGPTLEVLEILSLVNDGDRTIYGADGLSLRVALPSGFSGLEVESVAVAQTASGFASRWPAPPGRARLRFRYRLPAGEAFSRPAPYPASMVSVLIHPPGVGVESRSLANQGVVDFEGQKFLHLVGSNVAAGAPIDFRVTGGAGEEGHIHAEEAGLDRDTLKWGLLGLAVVLGALGVFYRPRKKAGVHRDKQDRQDERSSPAIHRRGEREGLEERRAEVIRQIAELDDAHEAGRVDEASYQKRRSELKAEAVRLTEALRQGDA